MQTEDVPYVAINVLETVRALQETLSQAAKQSLDRRFGVDLDRFVMNRLRIFVKRKHSDPCRGVRNIADGLLDHLGLYRLARLRVSLC